MDPQSCCTEQGKLATLAAWIEGYKREHELESKLQDTSYEVIDRRLHDMNAMRKQIEDERGTFVARDVYDLSQQRVRDEITGLRTSRDTSAGKKGLLEQFWPLLLALAMLAVGHFWK